MCGVSDGRLLRTRTSPSGNLYSFCCFSVGLQHHDPTSTNWGLMKEGRQLHEPINTPDSEMWQKYEKKKWSGQNRFRWAELNRLCFPLMNDCVGLHGGMWTTCPSLPLKESKYRKWNHKSTKHTPSHPSSCHRMTEDTRSIKHAASLIDTLRFRRDNIQEENRTSDLCDLGDVSPFFYCSN